MQERTHEIPQQLIEWLRGETLEERLRVLERGKLAVCIKCDKIFFDRETDEERQIAECEPLDIKHECVEFANYIVLRRGFRNILDAVYYFDGNDSIEEVIKYFANKRRKTWKS